MTSLTSCMGWGGVGWGINLLCSKNFQLRYWLPTTLAIFQVRCYLLYKLPTSASVVRRTLLSSLYQLPTTLASLVRHLPSTLLSSLSTSNYVMHPLSDIFQVRCYLLLSTSNYVSDVSDWQNLGTDVTKPWRRKKDRFHVPKPWPHCHFVKWPTKNWALFWGWNVHIWWPAHRKTIKPMELRRKLDKKDMKSIAKRRTTLDPQTSKGQRRHVQLPTRRDDYHWCPIDRSLSSWWRNHQLDLVKQDSARWSCMILNYCNIHQGLQWFRMFYDCAMILDACKFCMIHTIKCSQQSVGWKYRCPWWQS